MKLEPGMAYNTKTLNKVFAFVSVIFLICVVWMMFDDYIRPWKGYQLKALSIRREVVSKQLDEVNKKLNQQEIAKLQLKVEEAQKLVENKKSQLEQLTSQLDEIKGKIYAEKMRNGGFNAVVAETTFLYEKAEDHDPKAAVKYRNKLDEYRAKFNASKEKLKALQAEESEKKNQIALLQTDLTTAQKALDDQIGAKERLEISLAKSTPNPVMILRNLPFIDYLDPTLKIEQIVLENITDDRYFQQVPKVDRCITCHKFIDQPGYEDQENPFRTHPKLDLMVGLNSPHPMNSYGCTTCHGGEGHRVNDFQAIAHTPQNEAQEKVWREKYDWHPPHKVMQPMMKLQYTESACLKCHQGVDYIPQATALNEGREIIRENGCYACHKITGWEHMKRPGPTLDKIASKISKNFAKNWIWDPYSYNPHSRMPSFFNQSNNNTPEFKEKNIAEVNTIVEYLWEKSKSYETFAVYKPGDAEKGKQLISEIGCLGCHQVQGLDDQYNKAKSKSGPYLQGLGSKVTPDWLVSWLKKPHHYDSGTIMPSFRLTDDETNDIATYLLTLKNEKFKEKIFQPLNKKVRDELLVDYLSAFETIDSARKKVAAMSDRERTLELGKRSIGKYGCYSCHNVEGFDGLPPIGPELSNIGSKPIEQFGFGHEKIPHTRDAWITAHLQNPRRWDKGVPKVFKDLQKMPYFKLTDKEIHKINVALLGQVSEKVPLSGVKRLNADEARMEKGAKVLYEKNCIGCHNIDGFGGKILANYEDHNEAPPYLIHEGHRIQSDWLYNFLENVVPIRPWIKVRMPSFNLDNDEKNAIIGYFESQAKQVSFDDEKEYQTWEPGEREAAVKLFTNLACVSCHSTGFTNDTPLAPDLHKAGKRLRGSWIEKWLYNPQGILPYTSMPAFWPEGESPEPTILGGDSKKQIKALAKYVKELGRK